MKKLALLLGLLFLGSGFVYGANCSYKCVEPYDMSSKISTFFSTITGLNFTRTKISEAVLKKAISKSVQGDKLKVNINSFSGKDLSNGIFKSLTISGKNLNINDIYVSELELKSICEFNYVQYDKKGNLNFKEDFPMTFEMKMSADDINKSMKSERYQKTINSINKFAFAGMKVTSTESSIRGNKFYYTMYYSIPFMKEQKIELEADLKVDNGKISLKNTRLTSNSKTMDLKKVDSLMQHINPLDFSVSIFNNKDAKVCVKNIAIKNNIIVANGVIIIPKD
jgi:hypothetical protein